MYPQQTGWQPQSPHHPSVYPQPPHHHHQPAYSFLSAPPPPTSLPHLSPQQTGWQQATGWGGGGLAPQPTGWQAAATGGGGQQQQQQLMPQQTGWHDPRLQLMQSSFLPMNAAAPFAQSGTPVFQQPSLPAANLQSSMTMLNQAPTLKTPKIPWALTRDERRNYDQIFRAWDREGSGFISGEMAREVFGQSGLGQDDMAQIWTLADMDNRGKLNQQEFHVAMALIYRRLNGNELPGVLPAELVPASSKDLDSNVDFLKSLLRNDTHGRSTTSEGGPASYAKTRSFNASPAAAGERERKKDGTVYKHDDSREVGKAYRSSSRHLDRSTIRTGAETPSEDLAAIKRELALTSSGLEERLEARERLDSEDEALDEELAGLRRRVRRVKDDLAYASSGRPTAAKDEERRALERELLEIAHERMPAVERRIEEREGRRRREAREGVRARDRRNERYGTRRFDEEAAAQDERERGYLRGSYSDRRDDDDDRGGRTRSPPPVPGPPTHSLNRPPPTPAAPPPPKPTAAPAPGQTREERLALARARALQKLEERKRALGLGSAADESCDAGGADGTDRKEGGGGAGEVDSSVEDRIRRDKAEAEAALKRAEEARVQREADRKARLEAERNPGGGGRRQPSEPPTPTPTPPQQQQQQMTAGASKAPAPPPPKPRSILKSRGGGASASPAPPAPPAPAPPPPPTAPAPAVNDDDDEDPEDAALRAREARLKQAAEARRARLAALEAQEEADRQADEALAARHQQRESKPSSSSTPAPPPPHAAPPVDDEAHDKAMPVPDPAAPTPPPASLGAHNPFAKFSAPGGGAGSPALSSSSSSSTAAAAPIDSAKPNPFFKPRPPPTAGGSTSHPPPLAQPAAKKFVPPPPAAADDDDWDVIEDKANESDSSDDFDTAKRRKAELAKALFGGIMPSSASSTSSSPAPPSSSTTPGLPPPPSSSSSSTSPAAASQPKNPMLAALGGGSADPAARGGLFAAIQGGAKLKKAVTVDKSGPAVTGAVVGGSEPPAHIVEAAAAAAAPAREASPSPAPAADEEDKATSSAANPNRQSVDWYAGLAANAPPSSASAPTSLPAQAEEADADEPAGSAGGSASQAPVDVLDGVDTTVSLKVRTLFAYDGQRPEDLSFTENVMVDAHPPTDPASPWYYGTLVKDRSAGWFPASYVAEVADVVQAKALYSYTGSSDQEMPFVEGDVLTVVDHADDSWWKAVADGVVFLVPAAYLELLGTTTDGPSAPGPPSAPAPPAADPPSPPAAQSPTSSVVPATSAEPRRSVPLFVTSPPDDVVPPAEEDASPAEASDPSPSSSPPTFSRTRSASSASSLGEGRRAPPAIPANSRRLSAFSAVDAPVPEGVGADDDDDNSDDSSSSSDEDEADDTEAFERHEAERQRVLEAAGLRITIDPSAPGGGSGGAAARPRPKQRRRPPPSVPAPRRPQSMISDSDGTPVGRPDSMVSVASSLPPSPAADETTPRLEDAYDRYEALMSAQATDLPPPPPPTMPSLPEAALPPPSPTSPVSTTSGSFTGPREGRLSQMMAKLTASVAPLAAPEPSKRLSVASIGAPARQGNGSPATVTRASTPAAESTSWASLIADQGILASLSDKERKRQEAMFEFIATEASYVRDLQLIVEMFYARLLGILDDKELVVIFANVEDILVTSTFMLSELEERQKASRLYLSTIADVLAVHMQNVETYLPYCVNQSSAIKILQSLREKNPTLGSTLIAMRSEPALRGLDLSTYLLSPMQRITRYPLLLKQILHYTEPGEDHQKLEVAISEAESVLNRINEQIRARENHDRLAALSQELWVGSGRLDLTSPTRTMGPRRLLREGKATKGKGSKRVLTVVLTNDLLVLIEPSRTLYRMPMPLNEISVAEYPASSSFGFVLIPRYRGDRVVLKTGSAKDATDWIAAIERAIDAERRARLDMT